MADVFTDEGKELILQVLLGYTLKWVLLKTTYTPAAGDSAATILAHELDDHASYDAGWGGTGRKAATSGAVAIDATNHRAVYDAGNPTWSAINDGTVGAVALVKEGASDDTTTIVLAVFDPSNFTTNGGALEWRPNASGVVGF